VSAAIAVRLLGTTAYPDALERMRRFTRERIAGAGHGDEIWLTDHPPVYTLGFASRPGHLRDPGDIPVVTTERGGQVTYHGPGQAVAYLLLDLRARGIGVRELVCRMEAGVIDCLSSYGIRSFRRDGAPGIFVGPQDRPDVAKIASIGLKVSRGFTWHGVAVNGDMDLEPFGRIDPCGFAGLAMTDVRREAAPGREVRFDDLAERLGAALVRSIGG
jgi:lipoyl(octanoyl) transferase